MDTYTRGALDAATTFKVADYADTLANLWGKVSPPKLPLSTNMGLGALGYVAGERLGGNLANRTTPANVKIFLGSRENAIGHKLDNILHGRPLNAPQQVRGTASQIGAVLGEIAPQLLGSRIGRAAGTVALPAIAQAVYKPLVTNRRAAAIRNIAPKAALGLGATAIAAGIAHKLFSKKDDQ